MCGRFGYSIPPKQTAEHFGLEAVPERLAPRWNIAPTQFSPCVLRHPESGGRVLRMLRWGLVPGWAEDPKAGARMINARSETAADKPAFRAAFKARRCLVCADCFYEWQAVDGGKRPWLLRPPGGGPLAMAGLWEHWRGPLPDSPPDSPDDDPPADLFTFTILTRQAEGLVADLHDRMPVILAPEAYASWLGPDAPVEVLAGLLADQAAELEGFPVSTRVNSPANDDPTIQEPAQDGLAPGPGRG